MRDSKFLRIVLYMILIISIVFYIKIYLYDDKKNDQVDLPANIKNIVWYEYDSLDTIKFNLGKLNATDKLLKKCKNYSYEDNIIDLNCSYDIKIKSVDDYRLNLVITGKTKSYDKTYYKYKKIIEYMKDNNLKDISNEEIESIINIEKNVNIKEYKSASMSKLSSLNQLSVDEYLDKVKKDNNIILILNPNMNLESFDMIPIYLHWSKNYNDYNFYYIDGSNLSVSDEELLNHYEDKTFKELLVGMNDASIVITGEKYAVINYEFITQINHTQIFDCKDEECDQIEYKLYVDNNEYNSLNEILKRKDD